MKTQAQRLAEEATAKLRLVLARATVAPHEGPAFTGSSNCLENITRDYYRRRQGHWFDADACRFFKTKFASGFYDLPAIGVTLFITTEKGPSEVRAASIRAYIWKSAEVETLGEFNAYSLHVARAALEFITQDARREAA